MIVGTSKERPTGPFPLQEGRGQDQGRNRSPRLFLWMVQSRRVGPLGHTTRWTSYSFTGAQLQSYRGPVTELQGPTYRVIVAQFTGPVTELQRPSLHATCYTCCGRIFIKF